MRRNGTSQIHLIPFDLGYEFCDVLSIDNTQNLKFAKQFIDGIKTAYKQNETVVVYDDLDLKYNKKKIVKAIYKENFIADQSICHVRLHDNLYCYILSNGVGVFILTDIDSAAICKFKNKLDNYSKVLSASIQKKLTQATILNRYEGDDIFPELEKSMFDFRVISWEIAKKTANKHRIKNTRPFSSCLSYKYDGFSYVLTIYVMEKGEMSDNEINYLLYSPISKKSLDENTWITINDSIKKHDGSNVECAIKVSDGKIHFSWSAVAVILDKKQIFTYNDIIENYILNSVIKAEIYVQSRWLIADNSMDNATKGLNCCLAHLQKMESLMELTQAELDNEISANMNTLHKQILQKIVLTSEIKALYKSVINQIRAQKKIKEAHDQDRKRRNSLIVNCFMAIFTASSLYKTIQDIIANNYSVLNIVIFGAMLVLAIGTMIFNYKNK